MADTTYMMPRRAGAARGAPRARAAPASRRLPHAPGVRSYPTKRFTTKQAQKWIIASALVTALIYGFRRLVELDLAKQGASNKGSSASRLAGSGSPPPPLAHWALAYGTAFFMLSLLALGAPEVAGALAVLEVLASFLTNGSALFADLRELQGMSAPADPGAPPAPYLQPISTPFGNLTLPGNLTNPFPGPGTPGTPGTPSPGAPSGPGPSDPARAQSYIPVPCSTPGAHKGSFWNTLLGLSSAQTGLNPSACYISNFPGSPGHRS